MNDLIGQLKRWRRREWLYRLLWGAARLAACAALLLAVCCFIDWKIDRVRDTPWGLRIAMLIVQGITAATLAYFFLWRLRVPGIDELAGEAEDQIHEFDHRLVTALQLNRSGADLRGVSRPLLEEVTGEAVAMAGEHKLPGLADTKRLEWAAMVFVPVAIAVGAFAAMKFDLLKVLLQRQLLADVEIPRSVHLSPLTKRIQPAGEPVRLEFRVDGEFTKDSVGRIEIQPEGLPRETVVLKYQSGEAGKEGLFVAEVKTKSSFSYRAYLEDGRTKLASEIEFVARPSVKESLTLLVLPDYVDPEKKIRYLRPQPTGDVTTLPDCGLEVRFVATKPIVKAWLVLLRKGETQDVILDALEMKKAGDDRASYWLDKIPAAADAYRIEMVDEHGFRNNVLARRAITSANYKGPTVKLLPEHRMDPLPGRDKGPIEDYTVNGIPITVDDPVLIGFEAKSPLGIRSVEIRYRVNPSDQANTKWTPLELIEEKPDLKKTGAFRPELGLFEKSGVEGSVAFYPIPSNDVAMEPPGLQAGGRFAFQTRPPTLMKYDKDGNETKLAPGDTVEFMVVAYDRRPGNAAPGQSIALRKVVVTGKEFDDWLTGHARATERFKEVFRKQKRVFPSADAKPGQP